MVEQAAPIAERGSVTPDAFRGEILSKAQPMVLRGQVANWPGVATAKEGDRAMAEYLMQFGPTRLVNGVEAPASEKGRFGLNPAMNGFNFTRRQGRLHDFLGFLLHIADAPDADAMAVQSEPIPELLPGFVEANPMPLLPRVVPRIWIGNRIRVMPHFDLKDNLACVLAGRRRFTLYPPEQIANLYPGPLELTPAGTPITMVDPEAPDLEAYPRFEEAYRHAVVATLDPGDAIYIPFGWWHGVDSLDSLSILVNYWWADAPEGVGNSYDVLLHALMSLKHLPPHQRTVWRGLLDHFVFEASGDPAAHIPKASRGVLGEADPPLLFQMREMLRQALSRSTQ